MIIFKVTTLTENRPKLCYDRFRRIYPSVINSHIAILCNTCNLTRCERKEDGEVVSKYRITYYPRTNSK